MRRLQLQLQKSLLNSQCNLSLPFRRPLLQRTGHDSGWASHYGGLTELCHYSGMSNYMPINFSAMWQHGVFAPYIYEVTPEVLTYGIKPRIGQLVLVATGMQKELLIRRGIDNVINIGAPFVYSEPKDKKCRIRNSVLVMPAHSINNMPHANDREIDDYCEWINKKYGRLDNVYACLHSSCLKNGHFWPEFIRYGIPVVGGARHNDANSYRRMWEIFSQFDIVTTSSMGGHVYYAMAAGCKVIIEGPAISKPSEKALVENHLTWRRLRDAGMNLSPGQRTANDKIISDQLQSPTCLHELAKEYIGFQSKKHPKEIRDTLRWSRSNQLKYTVDWLAQGALNRCKKIFA